ncbi:MAG: IMPACT family protein [Bacteroides sp.]|nr:IMPACT family protein [Eubacterium sp.]MCM1419244.1 IMPACT family protein [Roseburia sp.]MCM1463082.1 IMPACT family protein [Bacteroides sp.]
MGYKTVGGRAEARFIERKSEFIGYLSHTETEAQALAFIAEIRALHRKATHNCYAYLLRENNISRHSDDGEPSGTAGAPIYEVLRREGLVDVTCVVTRYFGGVLLGAGGLVRAYTQGAKTAVDAAVIRDMDTALRLRLTLAYPLYGRLGKIFAEYDVRTEAEDFAENVVLTLAIRAERAEAFKLALDDCSGGGILTETVEETDYNFS